MIEQSDDTIGGAHCETLSVDQAASLMRLGADSLRELIAIGDVPAVTLNRKHWVLLREDVLEYLREVSRRQTAERRARWAGENVRALESESKPSEPEPFVKRRAGAQRRPPPSLN